MINGRGTTRDVTTAGGAVTKSLLVGDWRGEGWGNSQVQDNVEGDIEKEYQEVEEGTRPGGYLYVPTAHIIHISNAIVVLARHLNSLCRFLSNKRILKSEFLALINRLPIK